MKMIKRVVATAALAVGPLLFASTAAAPPAAAEVWYVVATYPRTTQGWYDCGNAAIHVYKGHCKVDSDSPWRINLWASRG
ncbi:hypothetical protein ACQEUU_20880 [Nonomuraea sp. CA-218870]|uniref:hypothetical protein n=1 Tax=Nonomuraea sp. CA-218870 TaxID=3239998 RepID=UPI003D90117E